jgi:uncharacterized membrane protein YeiB
MSGQAAPVSTSERIYTLDVIRGFALLGIFIMNMPGFNTSFFVGADGSHAFPEWWDRTAETVRDGRAPLKRAPAPGLLHPRKFQ